MARYALALCLASSALVAAAQAPASPTTETALADTLDADVLDGRLAPAPVDADSSRAVWWQVALAGTGAGLLGGAAIERLHVGWWADRNPTFRFHDDSAYALDADKVGHAWGTMALARTTALALEAAGLDRDAATAAGVGSAWALLLVHEVYDGYGPYWGFSVGDVLGNTAGAAWEVGHRHVPAFQAFDFKVGYWPSGADERTFMEDYRGQTYWLTAVPHRLLPQAAKPYAPPWLGVALGSTVRGFTEPDGFPDEREWYVGLDLNVCGLGLRGPLAGPLCEVFRVVRLPMPAFRVSPEVRFDPLAY